MALIGLAAVAAGGYLAADTLGGPTSTTAAYETTVEKVVTVREQGRTVRRPVQVIRRVRVTTATAADGTQVITRRVVRTVPVVITRRVVRTVPVVRPEVVTRDGEVRTVVERRPGRVVTQTRTQVVTDRRTVTNQVTNQQTVTNQQVVTNRQTVTNERRVTVTRPVTSTQVTTVVQTVPTTVTQTRTVTATVTVPVTVTVTTKKRD